jgi:hypothetical protein
MTDRKRSKPADYIVGFGRPPKATQFTAGKSGNPKGRPNGSRPVGALLQEIIQERVSVSKNGRTRRIPAIEVMFRRLANDAMRSDKGAIKLLLSMVDRYAESPETALQFREMLAEDEAILKEYLREPDGVTPGLPSTPDDEGGDDDA